MARRTTDLSSFGSVSDARSFDLDMEAAMGRMARPSSNTGYRVVRALTWFVMLSFVAGSVFNLYAVRRNAVLLSELTKITQENYNPSVRVRFSQLGEQVVYAWYNGGTQIVPVAKGISWPEADAASVVFTERLPEEDAELLSLDDGENGQATDGAAREGTPVVRNVAFVGGAQSFQPTKEMPNSYVEHLTYSAVVNGSVQYITILFRIDDLSRVTLPSLIAQPSLVNPENYLRSVEADAGPAELSDWKVDAEQGSQLEAWAKAYSTDDRASLKRLTGDTNKESVYVGLVNGGWTYVPGSLNVIWSKSLSEGDAGYARVRWEIQEEVDTGTFDPRTRESVVKVYRQEQVMDLLVSGKETALLSVIDWGEAGSYQELHKFGSAFTAESAPGYVRK